MEFNPGLFTCVTFPFLFGVMFGDILHGGLLLVLGLFLILNNDSISDTKYIFNNIEMENLIFLKILHLPDI